MSNVIEQFRELMIEKGLLPPDFINADGRIHRFQSDNKSKNLNGWYALFSNKGAFYVGSFGCWKRNLTVRWHQNKDRELTSEEKIRWKSKMEEAIRLQEAEQECIKRKIATSASKIWLNESTEVPSEYPYLLTKKIKPIGIKAYKGWNGYYQNSLLIPVYCSEEPTVLQSLQFIWPDGTKRFLRGGKMVGGHFLIGGPIRNRFNICEGYATGVSIYELTGNPTIVAFYACNLLLVSVRFRNRYPCSKVTIFADNDKNTPGNPGLTKAEEAAKVIGAKLYVPELPDPTIAWGTDMNDLINNIKE